MLNCSQLHCAIYTRRTYNTYNLFYYRAQTKNNMSSTRIDRETNTVHGLPERLDFNRNSQSLGEYCLKTLSSQPNLVVLVSKLKITAIFYRYKSYIYNSNICRLMLSVRRNCQPMLCVTLACARPIVCEVWA